MELNKEHKGNCSNVEKAIEDGWRGSGGFQDSKESRIQECEDSSLSLGAGSLSGVWGANASIHWKDENLPQLPFWQNLEGMARYAGQLLVPAEGFGRVFFWPFLLLLFWLILGHFSVQ